MVGTYAYTWYICIVHAAEESARLSPKLMFILSLVLRCVGNENGYFIVQMENDADSQCFKLMHFAMQNVICCTYLNFGTPWDNNHT